MSLLDYIEDYEGIQWIGGTNELNASYVADAYARLNGISCLVTTHGVGELSAMNGLAGAFAEQVPIIHIVGYPPLQRKHMIMHHQLGPNGYFTFSKMAEPINSKVFMITQNTTTDDIDDLILTCYHKNRPVYLAIPMDLYQLQLDSSPLEIPLQKTSPPNQEKPQQKAISSILRILKNSPNVILLADAGAHRDNILEEVDYFARKCSHWPLFTTLMGKSAVNEQLPSYAGILVGQLSLGNVEEILNQADVIITFGRFNSDMNTGSFTLSFPDSITLIELHDNYIEVDDAIYPNLSMKPFIPLLADAITNAELCKPSFSTYKSFYPRLGEVLKATKDKDLSHEFFWPHLQSYLKEGDIIAAEPGTASFGLVDVNLPKNVSILAQYLWASIGYATAAVVGAAITANSTQTKDMKPRRVVGLLGDGSFHMTVQELSNLVRYKLSATIFLFDNNGYTVEKYIHGVNRKYNEINNYWEYEKTLEFFGAKNLNINYFINVVGTEEELVTLFSDNEFCKGDRLQFVILKFHTLDAPRYLKQFAIHMGRADEDGNLIADS